MLVITRKPGQSFVIGDLAVTILAVRGKGVRVGVSAPKNTSIVRSELLSSPGRQSRITQRARESRRYPILTPAASDPATVAAHVDR